MGPNTSKERRNKNRTCSVKHAHESLGIVTAPAFKMSRCFHLSHWVLGFRKFEVQVVASGFTFQVWVLGCRVGKICFAQVVWQVLQAELPGGDLFTGTGRWTGWPWHRI